MGQLSRFVSFFCFGLVQVSVIEKVMKDRSDKGIPIQKVLFSHA